MKIQLLIVIACLFSLCMRAQKNANLTDEEKLARCITANTSYFTFSGQQPEGGGWTKLQNLFQQNQFVAWGEYHNSPLLSQLAGHALESAAANGFRAFCTETSPFVAGELSRISKMKSPADTIESIYKKGINSYGSFPFFSTREDAQMLTVANRVNIDIWGIDQEFQMAFPYCLDKIYNDQPSKIKLKYKQVYDSARAKWWSPEPELLDSLKNAIQQQKYKLVLEDIKTSEAIYSMNGSAPVRAALMKKNFFNYYDRVNPTKKIFFKMGNNHLGRGINIETQTYDIGNAISELAARNKTGFANVFLMVRYTSEKGKVTDDYLEEKSENPKVFSKLYDKDKWILVDVRSLNPVLKYDNSITRLTYQVLEKYDYVLISPEVLQQ